MQQLKAPGKAPHYSLLALEVPDLSGSQELPYNRHQPIENWPSEPKTLQEASNLWVVTLGPPFALLLVSIASIGLGLAVFRTNGTVESTSDNRIMQAMAITATLWPILFAAVLGPTMRAAALYRAEHGVRLGILELLFTSQTLVSTLRSCLALRIASIWSLILVVVWSLSPMGGQGALRALSLRQNTKSYKYPMMSYPSKSLGNFSDRPFNSGLSGQMSLMNGFRGPIGAVQGFEGSVERLGGVQESIKVTQCDLWRNVRVPFLHTLEGYNPQSTEWLIVPNGTIPGYSSLIGVPVRGFPSIRSGNTSFVLETNYQVLECKKWRNATDWIAKNNASLIRDPQDEAIREQSLGLPNIELFAINDTNRYYIPGLAVSNVSWPKANMKIVFRFWNNLTICNVRTEYVEAAIQCARDSEYGDLMCHASKMRRLTLAPDLQRYENLTALDIGRNLIVLKYIPYTGASEHPREPSVLERWLKDPPTFFDRDFIIDPTYYDNVPLDVFSTRLSTVLNTYLRATLNTTNIIGSDGTSIGRRDDTWGNTTGVWTEFTAPVYQIDKIWLLLYMLSAIVLTISALMNIVFRILTHTPDILTSVSALTRDSMFIQLPSPASTMDGSERARLLQNKRIMIQDVCPDKHVGRIALSDVEGAAPLQKDRLYM